MAGSEIGTKPTTIKYEYVSGLFVTTNIDRVGTITSTSTNAVGNVAESKDPNLSTFFEYDYQMIFFRQRFEGFLDHTLARTGPANNQAQASLLTMDPSTCRGFLADAVTAQ